MITESSLVLAHGGSSARVRSIPALCEALKSVNPSQSLDVTRSLLDLVLAGRTQPVKEKFT